MKVLVVGASGQVARSLAGEASKRRIALMALGRPDLDLTDKASLARSLSSGRPDVVINAAAYTNVDRAEKDKAAARALNSEGPGVLAALCNRQDIPLVHISTDYVFDGTKKTAYLEADQTRPLGIYGHSKRNGEKAVVAATPRHVIVRTAWIYSPYGHNFLKTMLRLSQSHDSLSVVADQRGCPTYAPHLAQGLLDMAVRLHAHDGSDDLWGIYNMAAGGEASWFEFAQEIFACLARQGGPAISVQPIRSSQFPTAAKRPANSRLECTKIKDVFGIELPGWQSGTAQCVHRLVSENTTFLKATNQ